MVNSYISVPLVETQIVTAKSKTLSGPAPGPFDSFFWNIADWTRCRRTVQPIPMTRYVLRRLLIALPALLLISVVVYAILALAPGDPIGQLAGGSDIPPEVRANLRQQFGLDDPVYVRYLKWLTNIVLGDWGYSFASRSPALGLISQRLPTTLEVVGTAYLVAVVIALPLGVSSATRPYTWYDHFATALSFAGFSLPTFFTGVLLIVLFSVELHWLPMVYDQRVTDPVCCVLCVVC